MFLLRKIRFNIVSAQNARSALARAGGVQIFRDVAQFAAMLLLVGLLSPEQYGAMALAQAMLGVASLIAAGNFNRPFADGRRRS